MPMIYLVAGARPNFMKIAPIVRALRERGRPDFKIIHTGQHFDHAMNQVFFDELGLPAPDVWLGAGGGGHAEQTAKIMLAFEPLCLAQRPDAVLVVGDVNSTMACAIVARKLGIPVAHVEAGLRSGDLRMPEEINRLVTDSISDWFFVTEPSAMDHLRQEGKPAAAVHFVGHVMVDNVLHQAAQLAAADTCRFASSAFKAAHSGPGRRYGVVTLHRPSNVDQRATLAGLASALATIGAELPLIFPVHPRTRARLDEFQIAFDGAVTLVGPQGYMEFLNLWKDAALVLTDSGGLQEETTALGVPCLTLRDSTERPVTLHEGTNQLVGTDPDRIVAAARAVLAGPPQRGARPKFWDGDAARRVVAVLAADLCGPDRRP